MWRTISENTTFQQHFNYQGTNYWEVFREIMEKVFIIEAAVVIQNIELTKIMLKNLYPSAIVATDDRNAFVRSVFMCSRINHIPTLLIQFGSPIGDAPVWMSPISADIMCVESKKEKQFLERISGNQGKIVHTGQPKFDLLRSRFINVEKSPLLKKYSINDKKKKVLLTSVPYIDEIESVDAILSITEYMRYLQCFYKNIQQFPDIQFIIKPHPNENPTIHQEMLRLHDKNDNLLLMEQEVDTFELIYISDLLITTFSTSGLEAVVLNKPVITINLTGRPDPVDYAKQGVAIGVYEEKNLCSAIDNALYDQQTCKSLVKARERYVRDYLLDEKSSERIGDIIECMCNA